MGCVTSVASATSTFVAPLGKPFQPALASILLRATSSFDALTFPIPGHSPFLS
jgi:hypothetical protein